MFQLTVHGETLAELGARLLAAADALGNGNAPGAASGTAGSSASTTRGGASGSASSVKDKPSDAEKEKPAGLDYEADVRPAVVKLSKVHGRDAALEVLKHFENADGEPCANGKDLQEADWPAALKKIKAAQKRLDAEKAAADAD